MDTFEKWLRAGALWACGLTFAGCDSGPANVVLRTDDASVLATGAVVYQKHCAACHGAHLEGQPRWRERDAQGRMPAPPHDASGHTWHHPDRLLFDITKQGVAKAAKLKDYDSAMPGVRGRAERRRDRRRAVVDQVAVAGRDPAPPGRGE